MSELLFLAESDIRRAASMRETVEWMRPAFEQLSSGEADVPLRMNMATEDGELLLMPVHLPRNKQLALKAVSIRPDNPAAGLPFIQALVTVFDGKTGCPLAVMDGEYLTALRTGAASGLATELCARPESKIVAIFGCGAQAVTQLEAVCAVRDVTRVMVFNRTRSKAETFCARMSKQLDIPVDYTERPEDLLEADIICTATTASEPLFAAEQVKPGAHINAVGAYRPDMTEVPADLIAAARITVDQRAACLAEAGDLVQPLNAGLIGPDHIAAELGEVSAGGKAGRTSPQEITVFKSVGNAAQDLAAAGPILAKARELGLGTTVRF
ncbi:MAG: ornithine cyclodeaminase [Acidobacteriota bacterium]|nr:ornithine cyclodeaminase [Acidobacteriota bacterium]